MNQKPVVKDPAFVSLVTGAVKGSLEHEFLEPTPETLVLGEKVLLGEMSADEALKALRGNH